MTSLWPTQPFSLGIATLIGLTMSDSPLPAANYDEAKVPRYELPDPLTMQDGAPVKSPKDWMEKRRPEVLELFQNTFTAAARPSQAGSSSRSSKTTPQRWMVRRSDARCSSPSLARSKLPRPTCSFIFQKMLMARSRHF